MSAKVKLSSKLPGDPEINGLDDYVEELLAGEILAGLIYLGAHESRRNIKTDEEVPIAVTLRLEPLGTLDQVPQEIRDLVIRKHEQRTGRVGLPFDALEVPKGEVDELKDDDPIPDDAEIFGDSREPLEGQEPIDLGYDADGELSPAGERVRMLRPSPRVAQDPSQIGEAFSFGGEE